MCSSIQLIFIEYLLGNRHKDHWTEQWPPPLQSLQSSEDLCLIGSCILFCLYFFFFKMMNPQMTSSLTVRIQTAKKYSSDVVLLKRVSWRDYWQSCGPGYEKLRASSDGKLLPLLCLKVMERAVAEGQGQPTGMVAASPNSQTGREGGEAVSVIVHFMR